MCGLFLDELKIEKLGSFGKDGRMDTVITIRAMGDNFIYIYPYAETRAFAVDPGESEAVVRQLERRGLSLTHILVTHRHYDHCGGVEQLKRRFGCEVICGESISGVDRIVKNGDIIKIGDLEVEVIGTPGHTAGSVCYYVSSQQQSGRGVVFGGDTLFVAGCGRVFGPDFKEMYQSLKKLAKLPEDTLVYGGHDYIEENFRFALQIGPDNEEVSKLLTKVRGEGGEAIESTIGQEKRTNVFMRAGAAEEFAKLRKRKDVFY